MSLKQIQIHRISKDTDWGKLRKEVSEGDGITYSRSGKENQFLCVEMTSLDGMFFGVVKDSWYYPALIKDQQFQEFIEKERDIKEIIIKNASAKFGVGWENNNSLAVKDYLNAEGIYWESYK